jgi:hypothetical protein
MRISKSHKIVFLLGFLFFKISIDLKSQIINEISVEDNELSQLQVYLHELSVTQQNRYVVIYDLNECLYCDHHWVDQLLNLETIYKNITFILLFDETKEKTLINRSNFDRDYVFIDEKQLFKKQAFYSYRSIVYVIENDSILAKYPITMSNAYSLKYHLFKKGRQ